jgi:hypothetical protein
MASSREILEAPALSSVTTPSPIDVRSRVAA